jgi:ComEC/Rec2-related protein
MGGPKIYMQNISWLINQHLLSIFLLILGLLTPYFKYLYVVLILLIIFIYQKKCNLIIIIAYILGFVLATRQQLSEKTLDLLAKRNSIIDAQIKNITKVNCQKIELHKIKINENINAKFIDDFFYTKNNNLKIGDEIKFSINDKFKFWQNYVYVKKEQKSKNFFSLCNKIKNSFDKLLTSEAQKTCNAIFWGYNTTLPIRELYCLDKLGCQHLMARSGLHLSPINAILCLSKHKLSPFFGIIILIFYAKTSASSYSFLRAIFISLLIYLWRLIGFRENKKLIFCQALIATIIIWPKAIFTASFQLSFSLVAGLYFLVNQYAETNRHKRLKS